MTRDELVWKMVKEFERRCTANYSQGNPVDSMSAVLRVCVEELLRQPSTIEFDRAIDNAESELDVKYHSNGSLHKYAMARAIFDHRRARYSPPKRIPESVLLDIQVKVHEALQFPAQSPQQNAKLDEVERLIAELKLKGQK